MAQVSKETGYAVLKAQESVKVSKETGYAVLKVPPFSGFTSITIIN